MNPADFDKPIEAVIGMKTMGGCDFTFECIGLVSTIVRTMYYLFSLKEDNMNYGSTG